MQTQINVRIAGHQLLFRADDLVRVLEQVLPEPVMDHFAVVGGRRFPPKQVISAATGLDRADFTTHQARSILRRLGFTVARRQKEPSGPPPPSGDRSLPHGGKLSEALRPHVGKWVAVKDADVLVAADTFDEIVGWLERYDRQADMVFRVPKGPEEIDISLAG